MTIGDYQKETERLLMGDEEYPHWGYKPCDIMQRVEKLLATEKRVGEMKKLISELRKTNTKNHGRSPMD